VQLDASDLPVLRAANEPGMSVLVRLWRHTGPRERSWTGRIARQRRAYTFLLTARPGIHHAVNHSSRNRPLYALICASSGLRPSRPVSY